MKAGSGCVGGALVVWSRCSLATPEDRSSIPGVRKNNVLVTRSVWPTLVSSVCYASYAWRSPLESEHCLRSRALYKLQCSTTTTTINNKNRKTRDLLCARLGAMPRSHLGDTANRWTQRRVDRTKRTNRILARTSVCPNCGLVLLYSRVHALNFVQWSKQAIPVWTLEIPLEATCGPPEWTFHLLTITVSIRYFVIKLGTRSPTNIQYSNVQDLPISGKIGDLNNLR